MDVLTGTVERITYYNDESGYGVIKIKADKRLREAEARDGTVTVVGVMPELGVGEYLELHGEWVDDPKYGRQLRVERVSATQPTSLDGIRRYLSSGIVRGIGEATAAKIVDHFGVQTLEVLNRNPERLDEVRGLKSGLAQKLAIAWAENVAVRSTMIFLQQYGVSARMANRIYGQYGGETVNRVKENPYTLADEVFGIGFLRADQIARNMGMEADSWERIRAGLTFALNKLAQDGHTFAPRDVLIDTATELLQIDNDIRPRVSAVLEGQLSSGDLIADELSTPEGEVRAVYLPMYHRSETRSADLLRVLVDTPSEITEKMADIDWERYLTKLAERNEVALTAQQQGAVKSALTGKVSVLTGGPGTGKTTTLRMVIEAMVQEGVPFALASPTGRAAKRLQEATGYDAFTIHRLLGYSPAEGFAYDEDYPLPADVLIVDEASMIDLVLFYNMLRALKPEAHLMLVGDVDQLPSVGAGNVLRDVIDCGLAQVTRLDLIFRQGEGSHITINAHRINKGEAPFMDNQSDDFYFFGTNDAQQAGSLVVDIVTNRLPRKFKELGMNLDPKTDVQVIAPMYRGMAGVHALNDALQEALNPGRSGRTITMEKKLSGRTFRVGDKVMQTRNNYDKNVFNGDIGIIYAIDDTDNIIEVIIDEQYVQYDFSEADDLIHAYCISTHRSQGSEYPVVVMPVLTQHYMMLQRNLLYTAITRAKQMVVLVGDRKAVYIAVNNNKVAERFSGLLPRLMAQTRRLL